MTTSYRYDNKLIDKFCLSCGNENISICHKYNNAPNQRHNICTDIITQKRIGVADWKILCDCVPLWFKIFYHQGTKTQREKL